MKELLSKPKEVQNCLAMLRSSTIKLVKWEVASAVKAIDQENIIRSKPFKDCEWGIKWELWVELQDVPKLEKLINHALERKEKGE